MTVTKVIRYRTKPEEADENERLVRNVFSELSNTEPEGLRYVTLRLADGVTFVHIATIEGENPLMASEAFGAFQSGVNDRCEEGPLAADATVVGSYRMFPD
jgi:hypothetical protein